MVLVSKTSALIPFVCELIGCQGLWTTDLCSFRLMLRLEHDSGSVNVQPERGAWPRLVCHHLQSHHAKQLCLPQRREPKHALNPSRTAAAHFTPAVTLSNSHTETYSSFWALIPTEMHLNQVCDSCAYTHAMNINAASEACWRVDEKTEP